MYSDVGAAIGEGEGEVVGVGTHPATNTVADRKRAVRMIDRDTEFVDSVERHASTLTKS
jgi:hypothetical protein